MGSSNDWANIILYILGLIRKGVDKSEAISAASERFGVSESEIQSRCGF